MTALLHPLPPVDPVADPKKKSKSDVSLTDYIGAIALLMTAGMDWHAMRFLYLG